MKIYRNDPHCEPQCCCPAPCPCPGPIGPTGPTGATATIRVGSVITGDPGTESSVTNVGTDENAIFEFIIPQGKSGSADTPDVLTTVDTSNRPTTANGAIIFNETPLISGSSITHSPRSTDVQIQQPGIYQAFFTGTLGIGSETNIPASVQVQMYLNGNPVMGAVASHTFVSSSETTPLNFVIPFRVDDGGTLEVRTSQAGYSFENVTLTVIRLGGLNP